jgi:hypothetical protein
VSAVGRRSSEDGGGKERAVLSLALAEKSSPLRDLISSWSHSLLTSWMGCRGWIRLQRLLRAGGWDFRPWTLMTVGMLRRDFWRPSGVMNGRC